MRTSLVCSFAFFLLAIVSEETTWSREIPTRSKVEEIEQELDKVIEKKKLPAAVRLAFHDCVGGCDGCIDKDKPNNAGLEPFVKALEPTFKRYENVLTRYLIWLTLCMASACFGQDDAESCRPNLLVPSAQICFANTEEGADAEDLQIEKGKKVATLPTLGKEWTITFDLQLSSETP